MSEKFDGDKVDMSLLGFLPRALLEVARVMDYGQNKYERGGFLEVPNGEIRYDAAMFRHHFKRFTEGTYDISDPWYETEEGKRWLGKIRHDAQVCVNALFSLEIRLRREEFERQQVEELDGAIPVYRDGEVNYERSDKTDPVDSGADSTRVYSDPPIDR